MLVSYSVWQRAWLSIRRYSSCISRRDPSTRRFWTSLVVSDSSSIGSLITFKFSPRSSSYRASTRKRQQREPPFSGSSAYSSQWPPLSFRCLRLHRRKQFWSSSSKIRDPCLRRGSSLSSRNSVLLWVSASLITLSTFSRTWEIWSQPLRALVFPRPCSVSTSMMARSALAVYSLP